MTSLLQTAKAELRAAGMFADDADYDGDIAVQVMALMETFCAYGHSGASAAQTLLTFDRLVQGKPLTPLTGDDNEWDDVHDVAGVQQNLRCSTVFRDGDRAWDTVKRHKPITFPYIVE